MRFLAERGLSIDEIIRAAELEQRRSDPTNAERQARHRAKKRNAVTVTDAPPNDIDNLTPRAEVKTSAKPRFVLPDWVPQVEWGDFDEMRRKAKAPWTDAAKRGIVAELEKLRGEGHCPAKLLRKAVTRGWRSVFPGDDTRAAGSPTAKRPMNAQELRSAIAFAEDNGDHERVAELKRQLPKCQGPPERRGGIAQVGALAARAVNQVAGGQ